MFVHVYEPEDGCYDIDFDYENYLNNVTDDIEHDEIQNQQLFLSVTENVRSSFETYLNKFI